MLNVMWVKFKDYKNSLPMIMVMTVMALVLIYIFGKGFDGSYSPTVGIANSDLTATSEAYIEQLISNEGFEYVSTTLDEGKVALEKGQYMALVEIAEGFESGLIDGTSQVVMYKSGDSIEHQTLMANISNTGRLFASNEQFVTRIHDMFGQMGIVVDEQALHQNILESAEDYKIIEVKKTTLNDKTAVDYDSIKHSFMGYILFFSMFTMVFGIGSIVEEKENRVWQRQLVSPVSATAVLMGNMLTSVIVGMLQMSFLMIFSQLIFGIDLGDNLPAILIVLTCYVLSITCLGLLLSGLVNNSMQLGSFSPVVVVATSMIGGCMWPLEIITSDVLLFLADLMPQRWAYVGLKAIIVNNGGYSDIVMPVIYLLIIAVVLFALAMIPYTKSVKAS